MKILNKIVSLASLSIVMLLSTNAFADNSKVYPGSMCNWRSSPNTLESREFLALKNKAENAQWVTCPVVRDSVKNTAEFFSVTVNGNASQCRIVFITEEGEFKDINYQNHENPDDGTRRRTFVWFKGKSNGPKYPLGAYSIECLLGKDALIESYFVKENT